MPLPPIIKQVILYGQIAVIAAAGVAIAFLYWRMTEAEKNLGTAREAIGQVQTQLGDAIETNKRNVEVHRQALAQLDAAQDIAKQELEAYKARDQQFRSIVDEIRSTPPADRRPVSPLVCRTVDRLYPSTTSACGD